MQNTNSDQIATPLNKYLTENDREYTPKDGFKRTAIYLHGFNSSGEIHLQRHLASKDMRCVPDVDSSN